MKHLLLLPALLSVLSGHSLAAERPNIITVFIDDMGWSDLSCFNGTTTKTENIDRLAAEGIKFTNFYVNSPICSPSRVALTTGQYPQRWRITSYLNNRNSNNKRGMAQWLDLKAPTLARELKKNGYATGHFGKWHMGGQRDVDDAPAISEYGFDRSLTNFEGMGAKLLPLTMQPGWKKPGKIWANATRLGEPVTWMQRSHITKGFVGAALTFIDESQKKNKAFFVNVWPDDVHSPFFPPLDKWGDGKRALYYGVLDAMDEQLAPLFDRIRNDEKLKNNTLIIVASDNGHEPGAGKSDPLRGAKTWLYEGGIRSPLIVWGPGLLNKETVGKANNYSILCALDLNRSLYALTKTPLPKGTALDGEDLSETLLGNNRKSREAPIFWRRPPDRPGFGHGLDEDNPDLAVRDGKWKFLINYDGSDPQLYHMNKDAEERHNVAANFPEVTKRLRAEVVKWNKSLPQDAGNPTRKADPALPDAALPTTHFVNPIGEGADPWIVRDERNKRYLWCLSEGNRAIAIHTSENLSSLGEKHIVWRAPRKGPYSKEIWAPELHHLEGHWHIYFAGSDGTNANHLAYVLRSKTDDPLGEYELHGPLATGEGADRKSPNLWAIDMTPLRHKGKLYALWSGWDGVGSDRQLLYLAPMKSPTELAGPRVQICSNDDFPWEFTEAEGEGRGLNEGPQILQTGNRTLVLYSCGASWLPTYKLGMLELIGDNPLDPKAWKKHELPVFIGTEETYGIGHSCFAKSPDGSEWWHIYHAKRDRQPGWRRAIFAQPMKIGKEGYPEFGRPVAAGKSLERPGGEKTTILARRHYTSSLQPNDHNRIWSYLGHHQFYDYTDEGLHLGREPANPINAYRSGEKVVLAHPVPSDLNIEVTIDFLGNREARDGGILFRTSGASVGFDAQRGYFAGLIPRTNLIILGKMDGTKWRELARKESPINPAQRQRLGVTMVGSQIVVTHNGARAIVHSDATFATGTVGLRVVNTRAVFSELHLKPGFLLPEDSDKNPGFKPLPLPRLSMPKHGEGAWSGDSWDTRLDEWILFGGQWKEEGGILSVSSAKNGPRALIKNLNLADFELEVDVMVDATTQAGIVFRVDQASEGIDAYRGYYLGVHGQKRRVMWGASLPGWREIARRPEPITPGKWHRLRVTAHGSNVKCFLDDKEHKRFARIDGVNDQFKAGLLGFRVLGNKARFRNLTIRGYRPVPPGPAQAYTNPVQAACADPVVMRVQGMYYAYCTYSPDFPTMPRGIRGYSSPDLVHWKDLGYVLKNEDSWGKSRFWAPDIVEKDGTYYLYYAADTRICVATAKHPAGPFIQAVREPMEPESIRIDAHVFEDDGGQNYFYYVRFNKGNEIWGGKLNEDMISVNQESLRLMIKPDQGWEQQKGRVVEGAEVIKHKGTYYLTYSGSHFESPDYAVGYATSRSPLGPWKKFEFNPIMKSTSYAHGSAHHCLTSSPDGTEHFIVYHRHNTLSKTEPRQMSIDRIQFVPQESGPDVLEVWGPTSSPQPLPSGAENAGAK